MEVKLISMVAQYPELYDVRLRSSRDFRSLEQLWMHIGSILSVEGSVCKKKWRYLRDYYIKERRILKANKSGAGSSGREMWKYFHLLYFLDPTLEERETVSNFVDQAFSDDTTAAEVANQNDTPDTEGNSSNQNIASASEERPGSSTKRSASEELPGPSLKRIKKPSVGGVDGKILETVHTLWDKKEEEAPCPDTEFLLSLVPLMKKVSENKKLPLRMAIKEAIHQASQNDDN